VCRVFVTAFRQYNIAQFYPVVNHWLEETIPGANNWVMITTALCSLWESALPTTRCCGGEREEKCGKGSSETIFFGKIIGKVEEKTQSNGRIGLP